MVRRGATGTRGSRRPWHARPRRGSAAAAHARGRADSGRAGPPSDRARRWPAASRPRILTVPAGEPTGVGMPRAAAARPQRGRDADRRAVAASGTHAGLAPTVGVPPDGGRAGKRRGRPRCRRSVATGARDCGHRGRGAVETGSHTYPAAWSGWEGAGFRLSAESRFLKNSICMGKQKAHRRPTKPTRQVRAVPADSAAAAVPGITPSPARLPPSDHLRRRRPETAAPRPRAERRLERRSGRGARARRTDRTSTPLATSGRDRPAVSKLHRPSGRRRIAARPAGRVAAGPGHPGASDGRGLEVGRAGGRTPWGSLEATRRRTP